MSGHTRKQQLFQRTLELSGREPAIARPAGPRPGDLFACPETAGHSVEWAVLATEQGPLGRALVVPVDLDPQLGSADIATAAGSSCGSASLRCGFPLWVPTSTFDPRHRTGQLSPADLERARQKQAEVASGAVVASFSERETEAEPGYQRHLRGLARARGALEARETSAGATSVRPPERRFFQPVAIAASFLLLLSLGLGAGWLTQSRKTMHLAQTWERSEAELREEVAELRARGDSPARAESLVNLPLAFFPAVGAVRGPAVGGPAKTLNVSPSASHFVLVLGIRKAFPEYRLQIFADGEPQPLWSRDPLFGGGLSELTVALPRQYFPAGTYRIRLSGLRDGRVENLAEHFLEIEAP